MHIAIVTIGDSRQVGYWSGTPYHMAQALTRNGHRVTHLGPLPSLWSFPYRVIAKLAAQIGIRLPHPLHLPIFANRYARDAARRVISLRPAPDLLLAIAGSTFAWRLPAGIPLVYASDSTIRLAVGYHPNMRQVSAYALRTADDLERLSIARADIVTYPSRWATDSAIRDYGTPPERVQYLPWGANLEHWPQMSAHRGQARQTGAPLRLLLVGGNWHFKGADIAVAALRHLRANGVDAYLTICGCVPPAPMDEPGLTIIPFLYKSDPAQKARLDALYQEADLFILPTRSECYGIVFCEAASYGLPSIAPATGGVPSAVQDGVNGLLVPEGADGAVYARTIHDLAADPERLASLSLSSRHRFETELNWDSWVAALMQRVEQP